VEEEKEKKGPRSFPSVSPPAWLRVPLFSSLKPAGQDALALPPLFFAEVLPFPLSQCTEISPSFPPPPSFPFPLLKLRDSLKELGGELFITNSLPFPFPFPPSPVLRFFFPSPSSCYYDIQLCYKLSVSLLLLSHDPPLSPRLGGFPPFPFFSLECSGGNHFSPPFSPLLPSL